MAESRQTGISVTPARATSGLGVVSGMRRLVLGLFVFWLAVGGAHVTSPAFGQVSREYKLKAAFLYQFTSYVRWPERAFTDEKSAFVIGILGPDPVGADLRKIATVKKVGGRSIEVRTFREATEVRGCHLLFISRAVNRETQAAGLKKLVGRNILLVGETPDFLENGGVIAFIVQNNRVRILISKSAYEREHLDVSSKLLRVATVVK